MFEPIRVHCFPGATNEKRGKVIEFFQEEYSTPRGEKWFEHTALIQHDDGTFGVYKITDIVWHKNGAATRPTAARWLNDDADNKD